MNAERRKEIERAKTLIEEAKSILETAASDEREYYDNMPESLQSGDKGEKAIAAADALDEAVNAIDDIVSNIETAVE
jgi:hypothetical protein